MYVHIDARGYTEKRRQTGKKQAGKKNAKRKTQIPCGQWNSKTERMKRNPWTLTIMDVPAIPPARPGD